MGVAAILAQHPHSKPATTDRSPAPFVHASDDSTELEFRVRYHAFVDHASDDSTELEFRVRYHAFVDAFRAGAQRLRDRTCEYRDMFPLWAFPPALPFNAPD